MSFGAFLDDRARLLPDLTLCINHMSHDIGIVAPAGSGDHRTRSRSAPLDARYDVSTRTTAARAIHRA
jgi:hypothetical protein